MAMSLARIELKGRLLVDRGTYRNGRNAILCDLCSKPGATDLHELLVERDDVATEEQMRMILESEENVVFLCNFPCNMVLAKEKHWRNHLIAVQIDRYGRKVLSWTPVMVYTHRGDPPVTDQVLMDRVTRQGRDHLCKFVQSVGLKAPEPYLLRIQAVAEQMLRHPDPDEVHNDD